MRGCGRAAGEHAGEGAICRSWRDTGSRRHTRYGGMYLRLVVWHTGTGTGQGMEGQDRTDGSDTDGRLEAPCPVSSIHSLNTSIIQSLIRCYCLYQPPARRAGATSPPAHSSAISTIIGIRRPRTAAAAAGSRVMCEVPSVGDAPSAACWPARLRRGSRRAAASVARLRQPESQIQVSAAGPEHAARSTPSHSPLHSPTACREACLAFHLSAAHPPILLSSHHPRAMER